jgi:hypothetical protein
MADATVAVAEYVPGAFASAVMFRVPEPPESIVPKLQVTTCPDCEHATGLPSRVPLPLTYVTPLASVI